MARPAVARRLRFAARPAETTVRRPPPDAPAEQRARPPQPAQASVLLCWAKSGNQFDGQSWRAIRSKNSERSRGPMLARKLTQISKTMNIQCGRGLAPD